MRTYVLVGAFIAVASGLAAAAERCAPEAAQFDFWVGQWRVTQQGKPLGVSHIERVLGGCALLEHWQGVSGGTGKSLNFFDRADGQWHQTWIDADGDALYLAGRLVQGSMRLEGLRPAIAKQPATRHRITWTALGDGRVRQLWESTPTDREQWSVQFDGLYEPVR